MVRGPSFTQRCDVVKFFLASEKMVVGNSPPESMFQDSRKCFLEINVSREVPLAVYQCLRQTPKEAYSSVLRLG